MDHGVLQQSSDTKIKFKFQVKFHSIQKQQQVTGELERCTDHQRTRVLFSEKLAWQGIKQKVVRFHSGSYLLHITESKELLAICRIRPLSPISPIYFSGSLFNNSYKSFTEIPNNFLSSRCAIFFNECT